MRPGKPVLVAGLDEGAAAPPALVGALRDLGVPFFTTAERVFRAIACLNRYATRHPTAPAMHAENGCETVQLPQGVVAEYLAKDVLKTIGIPIPQGYLAKTLEQALLAGDEIGFPVALKAQSAELSHKSDAGGVILNLGNAESMQTGWSRLHDNLRRHDAHLALDGVLVEAMGKRGTELIIGARRDPDWGLILLAGFGGVTAEVLQDVRLLPPGLAEEAIIHELRRLQAGPILDGFRGAPALDIAAVASIIAKLDAFLQANPQIIEVDINPVAVYPKGEGAVALDALMLVHRGVLQ
jgi:acyl-CoA synthetase (NDP forming)